MRSAAWLGALGVLGAAFVAGYLTRPGGAAAGAPIATADTAHATTDGGAEARPGSRREPVRSVAPRPAPPEEPELDMLTRVRLGTPMRELFEADPRDEAWAAPLERFYDGEVSAFLAVLVPDARDLAIECRQSICNVSFVVPAEQLDKAFSRQQAMPLGTALGPWQEAIDGDDTHRRVGMFVFFTAETRPFDAIVREYQEIYATRFAPGLEAARDHYDAFDAEQGR